MAVPNLCLDQSYLENNPYAGHSIDEPLRFIDSKGWYQRFSELCRLYPNTIRKERIGPPDIGVVADRFVAGNGYWVQRCTSSEHGCEPISMVADIEHAEFLGRNPGFLDRYDMRVQWELPDPHGIDENRWIYNPRPTLEQYMLEFFRDFDEVWQAAYGYQYRYLTKSPASRNYYPPLDETASRHGLGHLFSFDFGRINIGSSPHYPHLYANAIEDAIADRENTTHLSSLFSGHNATGNIGPYFLIGSPQYYVGRSTELFRSSLMQSARLRDMTVTSWCIDHGEIPGWIPLPKRGSDGLSQWGYYVDLADHSWLTACGVEAPIFYAADPFSSLSGTTQGEAVAIADELTADLKNAMREGGEHLQRVRGVGESHGRRRFIDAAIGYSGLNGSLFSVQLPGKNDEVLKPTMTAQVLFDQTVHLGCRAGIIARELENWGLAADVTRRIRTAIKNISDRLTDLCQFEPYPLDKSVGLMIDARFLLAHHSHELQREFMECSRGSIIEGKNCGGLE